MGRARNKGRVLDGWLVILKPVGVTSARAVAMVKRITQAAKVGHGGTLDPFSEGLLPMALGAATKMLSLVLEGDKSYTCWIRFGSETDSGDPTGNVVGRTDFLPDRRALEEALQHFTGIQQQVPPVFSAIHVNGVRSYELARRGEAVALPARQVLIHKIHLEAYADGLAQVNVDCGKGAYMRSLAQDLGRYLGSLAHLERLLRTKTLGFSLEDGITPEQLSADVANGRLRETILPMDRVLDDIPALRLRLEDWHKVVNGQSVRVEFSRLSTHEAGARSTSDSFGNMDSEEISGNRVPEEISGNRVPEEISGNRVSEEISGNRVPEEISGNHVPGYLGKTVRLMTHENHFFGVGVLTEESVADGSWLCQPKRLFRVKA